MRGWDNLHDFQLSSVMKWQSISSLLHQQKCKTYFICNLSHVPAHSELQFFLIKKPTEMSFLFIPTEFQVLLLSFSPELEVLLHLITIKWRLEINAGVSFSRNSCPSIKCSPSPTPRRWQLTQSRCKPKLNCRTEK